MNESNHSGVIHQLDDLVRHVPGCTVVCWQCKQQWTEYTLERSSAQRDGVGSVISDMDRLRSLCQKVLNPETCGGVQAEQEEFLH